MRCRCVSRSIPVACWKSFPNRGGGPPTLAVGRWRGEATRSPERLHFSVPRTAFETDATRGSFSTAVLAMRRGGRLVTFELLFLVLPDRPGSVALDQKMRTTVP